MALILAVNPGGTHSPTLARLARELPGHELIGADSCAVAIAAVDRRVPDLVLFPPLKESEVAELLARLRAVPTGVRTLDLPPLIADKPNVFADFVDHVRESLAAPPMAPFGKTDERGAHLIAAAGALISWVRARRDAWAEAAAAATATEALLEAELETAVAVAAMAATAPATPVARDNVLAPRAIEGYPIAEPMYEPPGEAAEPAEAEGVRESSAEAAARHWRDWQAPIRRWLPRVAALAVLAALAAAVLIYLPNLRAKFTTGTLVLESGPPGSEVFIDGDLVGVTPIQVELPYGHHNVEFRSGAMSRIKEVAVFARSRVIERVDWMQAPTGTLQLRSDPPGARVLVDGAIRGNTPLTLNAIPAGSHVVTIENKAGSVRRTVTIADGQTVELTESIFPGWLAVFSPFELEIIEGSGQLQADDRGRTMLTPGPHKLRFRNRELGFDEVRTVEILPGDTTTLNLTPQTTINITATEPSEVWIDDKSVGQTPVANLKINLGSRLIRVKPATGGERQFTVTATSKPVQLRVDFSKPQP